LLIGFNELHAQRDRHFGNGRLARNVFEDSVRGLADRVANVTKLSEALLTTLTVDDIRFPELSGKDLDALAEKYPEMRITCSGCQKRIKIAASSLGGSVRCKMCETVQQADWAELT
jgi:predicted Zn finger-like uncharacterized protein